jgi:hypothetical protein
VALNVNGRESPELEAFLGSGLSLCDFAPLFCAVHQGEALCASPPYVCGYLLGAGLIHLLGTLFTTTTCVEPSPAAGVVSEGIHSPLGGRSMQDLGYELPRMHLPHTWVNRPRRMPTEGHAATHPSLPHNAKIFP